MAEKKKIKDTRLGVWLKDKAPSVLDVVADPFTERPGLEQFAQPAPATFAAGYQTFCGT